MYLSLTVYLKTNKRDELLLHKYKNVFHSEIERIIVQYEKCGGITFFPYRDIHNSISFYSKNQVIHFAETIYELRKKYPNAHCMNEFSLMAKSFCLKGDMFIINFGKTFMSSPLYIKIKLDDQQKIRIAQGEIVKADIKKERKGYFAKVLVSIPNVVHEGVIKNEMGVDIGMRCPAVCYTNKGKIHFAGNGREIRYFNRRHKAYIKKNKNNYKRLMKFNHMARNYKNYVDHCVAKEVIEFAVKQNVGIIRLENLVNLQKKCKRHDQVCWSYERLQKYITYKARLQGIDIVYVDPRLTSKRCPNCGKINNVKGRNYQCKCGFKKHRDIVGAMNILHAPEVKN